MRQSDGNLTIQPMSEQYLPFVVDLERRCFSTPWSEKSISEELKNPWSIWLVAIAGECFLGYMGMQYGPDGGDIMTIATEPEYRGQGVAWAMLQAGIACLLEKRLGYLTLEVRPSNEPAIRLYSAIGFRQVGRRPRYYQNPTEDALLLTLFFEEEDYADSGD